VWSVEYRDMVAEIAAGALDDEDGAGRADG